MSGDRLEAVAEAICEQADEYYWSLLTPDERAPYYKRAQAALDALQPELGELEAMKALLAATQEMQRRTIADFCALRDALPRAQVEQILGSVEEHKP
jgi:acyl-CoA reductase-like NAD-dependent aldehyde dehydrogenase